MALQNALEGAFAGQRANPQNLEFGEDDRGPDQTVARGRRGVGLESATDREDGPFQLGREAWGDVVAGSGQVVEALRAGPPGSDATTCGTRLRCGRRPRRGP